MWKKYYAGRCMVLMALLISYYNGLSQRVSPHVIEEVLREKILKKKSATGAEAGTPSLRGSEEYKFTSVTDPSMIEGEPAIAINPTDSNNIVVAFMNFKGQVLHLPIYTTFDGGDSWFLSSFNTLNHYTLDNKRINYPVAGGGDPVLCFDANGTLYFFWIYLGLGPGFEGRWHNFWASSEDGGLTFMTEGDGKDLLNWGNIDLGSGRLNLGGHGIFDRYWCAVDRSGGPFHGQLYLAGLFIRNDTTQLAGDGIVMKIKRSGSSSFDTRHIKVSNVANAQFTNLTVDDNGWIHLVYGEIDNENIVYQVSKDGGQSFLPPQVVGDFSALRSGNRIIHDRENAAPVILRSDESTLHISWTFLGDPPHAIMSSSYDLGRTWTDTISLTRAVEAQGFDGTMTPTLTSDLNGQLSVFLFALKDKVGEYVRLDQDNNSGDFQLKEVISGSTTDFGDYSINNPFNETFFGDYNSAIRHDCKSYVVFSDGRNAQGPKVYLSRVDHCDLASIRPVLFADKRVHISPNPTSGTWSLSFEAKRTESYTVRLMSTSSGQVIDERKMTFAQGKSLVEGWRTLPQGTYAVQVMGQKAIWVLPLIVQSTY